ncbi:ABC transporter transmembrane domain-containing protein [Nitrosovibrio sp. Nv4]|uniref:ABC transporter transmembrane domain-containing protein n=1 Tax=Nitrosovibrio sp. Nv4 TaxID=1945880 RepID=UPI000BC413C8|nr:ABC transporter transmembrane domain-containing protein [Nitrosovibrio sp. Nv4]SOD40822.1 ATP-binding cassette, subfamily B, MsbA [Nitrosovibrio sp. Nv4]
MRTITSRQLCQRVMRYIAPYWDALILALTCMIAMAATVPMLTALVQPMLDGAIAGKNLELMQLVLLGTVGLFAVRGVTGHIGAYAISWVGNKMAVDLRTEMFDKLLILPSCYYVAHPSGSLVFTITSGASLVARAFTDLVTVMVKDTFTVLGLLGWMLYLNWELSLLTLLMVSVILLIMRIVTERLHGMGLEVGQTVDGLSRAVQDSVENHLVVKLHGGEKYEHQRMREQADTVSRFVMKRMAIASLCVPLAQIATAAALAIIIYVSGQQAFANEVTAGGFASLTAAMLMLVAPVRRIAGARQVLQSGLIAAESVFSLLDQEAEPDNGTIIIERAQGELRFEQVSFCRDREKNIHADPEATPEANIGSCGEPCSALRDITLTIRPYEMVALVGFRGSAAALANMVPRFANPTSGKILLDGHDLKSLKLASLRANIAVISAETTLFNDTIAANIAYGATCRATEAKITAAAQAAHASEFIRKMPEGLQTLVGEQGVKLTSGQRLRIVIARVLLKNPPILVLDEAYGPMDYESVHHVNAALDTLMQGRTSLVIANSLSTLEKADRIVLLDKGRVIGVGSHQELLARGGAYTSLARTFLNQNHVDGG